MEWKETVKSLMSAAEKEWERPAEAIRLYEQALSALPQSAERSTDATEILTALGETHYLNGQLADAFVYFSRAVACESGLGLAHIHLRLGQLRAERGELDRARDELMRAYMGSGEMLFDGEDPKYYALIKDIVEKVNPLPDPLAIVAEYLTRFYRDTLDDLSAEKSAVQLGVDDLRGQWRYCRAFRQVMSAPPPLLLPEGALMALVVKSARRDVWSDGEAMDFIRQVYEDAYLDQAIDYDALDQEQGETVKPAKG